MHLVTLAKARRVLRDRGLAALLAAARTQAWGVARAYLALGRKPEFKSIAQLLDFGSTLGGGVIRPFQLRDEILRLLTEVQKLNPLRVLEVGTANGGTLFLLSQVAHPQATILSIDLPGGDFGEGYAWWRMPLYRRFARKEQTMHLVRGDSHSPQTLRRVREALGGCALDLAFIDGDHSYAGVRSDFETYGALVRQGGLVVFHDIAAPADPAIQVPRFWNEVKQGYRHLELVGHPGQEGYGLGVLYV
jgi:predicted O-methyltransferase YrrM